LLRLGRLGRLKPAGFTAVKPWCDRWLAVSDLAFPCDAMHQQPPQHSLKLSCGQACGLAREPAAGPSDSSVPLAKAPFYLPNTSRPFEKVWVQVRAAKKAKREVGGSKACAGNQGAHTPSHACMQGFVAQPRRAVFTLMDVPQGEGTLTAGGEAMCSLAQQTHTYTHARTHMRVLYFLPTSLQQTDPAWRSSPLASGLQTSLRRAGRVWASARVSRGGAISQGEAPCLELFASSRKAISSLSS
jgi:hypothetical protein